MSQKEKFHLPSGMLEMEFTAGDARREEFHYFRITFKDRLMKRLVTDGAVFRQNEDSEDWKTETPESGIESSVDGFLHESSYRCMKTKDKQSRKVRWIVDCDEQVIIFLLPDGK